MRLQRRNLRTTRKATPPRETSFLVDIEPEFAGFGGPPVTDVSEGPWALFRLLYKRSFQPTGQPDIFEADVGAGKHTMRLRLRAASVDNPFDQRLLAGFTCPGSL